MTEISALSPGNIYDGIRSPVIRGSGVLVLHRALEASIDAYKVEALSPYWGLAPPTVRFRHRAATAITHSQPELGPWIAHPDSDLVATFHNYYLDDEMISASSRAQGLYYRYILGPTIAASLRRARWITAVSRATAGLVREHHAVGNRLIVIPNGVDTGHFRPGDRSSDGPVKILFAGNPMRRKGSEHLEALSRTLPDGVLMQYTVGTRSSAIDSLKQSNQLMAVERRNHDEMPELYRQVDMLFFPTRREGLSLVVLEAMACGLPIIGSRCSSMPELVDHGKGGFLFDVDDRDQMLAYLLQLAHDPGLRAAMGNYNREKILSKFTLEKMVAGYKQVFAACGT